MVLPPETEATGFIGAALCQCAPKFGLETMVDGVQPRFCCANTVGTGICPEVAGATELWTLKALDHGGARLHIASDVRGHVESCRQAYDAAYALLVAAILSPEHGLSLRLLARRLLVALQPIGHPSGDELLAVSTAAAVIRRGIAAP